MTRRAPIGVVCGSGIELDSLLDEVHSEHPFESVPGLAETTVPGHEGRFVHGRCQGMPLVLQCGRIHFYEGQDYGAVTAAVGAMYRMGVRAILFTNAAGGLNPRLPAGCLMAARRIKAWPYAGWPGRLDELEIDVAAQGCHGTGVYAWVHGPCYETRAEIAALQAMECDAVGMSTAPEAACCKALGIRTAVVSCITNHCLVPGILTHGQVVETARGLSGRLAEAVRATLPRLAGALS